MNVLLTVAIITIVAMWTTAVYARLSRLRDHVKQAWTQLDVDRTNHAVRNVYNTRVEIYNAALETFPANIVGPAAGFKCAKRFEG